MTKLTNEYIIWLKELKNAIRTTQIKASLAVNSLLIEFYWVLGRKITEKEAKWGSKFLETLSKDLQSEFPDMKGFSVSNLKTCKLFYNYFPSGSQAVNQIEGKKSSQAVNSNSTDIIFQIPWGHTKHIITKIKDKEEALYYIKKTIQNNWSRDVLALQIKSNLYKREGKSVNNFTNSLPLPFSDLAVQTLKDPYIFDFLQLNEDFKEKDIENQLVNHIRKFLLELGKGFAFVGQQYHIEISEKDYYIDLLFYHIKLKCYVVIELKNKGFIPEYAGKLNFYLSAVDTILKEENDKPTIGILLCREKNNIEAEFALRDINKPIGVSEFQLTEIIPDELKSSLPTIEEIEKELLNQQ